MSKELGEIDKYLYDFSDFVAKAKMRVPKLMPQHLIQVSSSGGMLNEDDLRRVWNSMSKQYVHEETQGTNIATMNMLLEQTGIPTSDQRWLSLGSGPGIYEAWFVSAFSNLSIVSLDISDDFIKFQAKLAKDISVKNPRKKGKLIPVRGSMSRLDRVGEDFDRVLLINSLPWNPNWQQTVEEVEHVLSPKEGSSVCLVAGSARVTDEEGRFVRYGPDSDELVDEFERNGLYLKSWGHIMADVGQAGKPVKRFFGVFVRTSESLLPWRERLEGGGFTNYNFSSGILSKVRYGNTAS